MTASPDVYVKASPRHLPGAAHPDYLFLRGLPAFADDLPSRADRPVLAHGPGGVPHRGLRASDRALASACGRTVL